MAWWQRLLWALSDQVTFDGKFQGPSALGLAAGALPLVVLCSSAWTVPLSETDSLSFGLDPGERLGLTFAGWVAVL